MRDVDRDQVHYCHGVGRCDVFPFCHCHAGYVWDGVCQVCDIDDEALS